METYLSFDEWLLINEKNIDIELAENGSDREMDFDLELEINIRYEKYLNSL
jgi:hypothetical protein